MVPDVDGLGIIPEVLTRNTSHPLLWFSQYHHVLHTLCFAIAVATLGGFVARQSWKTAVLCFVAFHLHLLEDLLGSRGPDGDQWPIFYLAPFSSSVALSWSWTVGPERVAKFLITFALLLATFSLAWRKGFSPAEIFSIRADHAFVTALRCRFPTNQIGG